MVDGLTPALGFPEIMPGFTWYDVDVDGLRIRAAVGGSGPPLLLLHGHPQMHLTWHKVAVPLARRFTVVASDLRGYGDSAKPPGGEGHASYAKRAMARDQVGLMRRLGHERFAVMGHDRGARVAHRMALDHPNAIQRIVLLDIAPTATMYALTNMEFARRYFWWFFLIQPFDLPERMIGADPEYFLNWHLMAQSGRVKCIDPRVFEQYKRCYADAETRHAICEDYRAAATIDLEHDAADDDPPIQAPLLVLWGRQSVVGELYDVLETWRAKSIDVLGHALDCGHLIQEEVPNLLLEVTSDFLSGQISTTHS